MKQSPVEVARLVDFLRESGRTWEQARQLRVPEILTTPLPEILATPI